MATRGVPDYIRSDNGSESTAHVVRDWLKRVGAKTLHITPVSPWENGCIESFNGKLANELLEREVFDTLHEAKVLIERWRVHYNTVRLRSSLGYRPPAPEAWLPAEPGSASPLQHRSVNINIGTTLGGRSVDFLRSQPDVPLIENDSNRGYAVGCNQGIEQASDDQMLLLNNDVVLTPGWLARLSAALWSAPDIGMVGPYTNCADNPQGIDAEYDSESQMLDCAEQWRRDHTDQAREADMFVVRLLPPDQAV